MIPEAYGKLIGTLVQRTKEGGVNWQPTSSDNCFAVHFKGGFSLSILSELDPDGEQNDFKISIYNKAGKAIDEFTISDSGKEKRLVEDLYESGRRKALKIDFAIETITNELAGEKTVGIDAAERFPKKAKTEAELK